jgi:hypothetical protein
MFGGGIRIKEGYKVKFSFSSQKGFVTKSIDPRQIKNHITSPQLHHTI